MPEPAAVAQRVLIDDTGPTDGQLEVLAVQLPVPEHLACDGEAEELWFHWAGVLGGAGILEVSDQLALEGLVESELNVRHAWRALEAERRAAEQTGDEGRGRVITGTSGQRVTNPAFRVWRDARITFLRFAEQLGLTPVARTRLGVLGLAGQKLQRDLEATLPPQPLKRGRRR